MSGRYCPSMSTKRAHSQDPIRSIVVQIKLKELGSKSHRSKPRVRFSHPKKYSGPRSRHFRISKLDHNHISDLDHTVLTVTHISTIDLVRMPLSPHRTTTIHINSYVLVIAVPHGKLHKHVRTLYICIRTSAHIGTSALSLAVI